MFHLNKLSDAQRKENAIARMKAVRANDDYFRRAQKIRKQSYSATHKPYERTAYGNLNKAEGSFETERDET